MEVAGLLLSAISFVDSAVKTGSVLVQLFNESGDAGKHVYNATQRLKTQKYTLELWEGIWRARAERKLKPTTDDGFREIWGEEGHDVIRKCLAQLNIKFGEAFRTLRSIDPDSFKADSSPTTLSDGCSSPASGSCDTKGPVIVEATEDAMLPKPRKHWYHRLSKGKSVWRRDLSSSSSLMGRENTAEEQAQLEQEALQHKLSPGTKFKWSTVHKEQIRLLVNDIDDWLTQLQTLASRCEEERNETKAGKKSQPGSIRAAAKALHVALRNSPSSEELEFKLEKERMDTTYFEQILGPFEYIDQTNRSFKFPLLLSNGRTGDGPILLLAEAVYGTTISSSSPGITTETPLDEIVKALRAPDAKQLISSSSVLHRGQHTTIVIHSLTDERTSTPAITGSLLKCTFADLLRAEVTVDPMVALWKRVQLACIIAISVLHLYETGWISEHLETNDFHFFGSADSQYHEFGRIAPYISAISSPKQHGTSKTPFDVLQRNPIAPSLLSSRDERLAILFHRLGIVLFELGRGVQYQQLFDRCDGNEQEVTAEIDKIPFGRPYRDLVKICLTGSLYANSALHIDTQFDRAIVERLIRLEEHLSAILHGELV